MVIGGSEKVPLKVGVMGASKERVSQGRLGGSVT